jgi:hypothetical protein
MEVYEETLGLISSFREAVRGACGERKQAQCLHHRFLGPEWRTRVQERATNMYVGSVCVKGGLS